MSGTSFLRKPSFTSLVVLVIIILSLYVLSPGTVVVLANHGYLVEDGSQVSNALDVIWRPIWWSAERVECVATFYQWYFDLLSVPPPDHELVPLI